MVAVRVEEPDILTLDEVADWLRFHKSTIYRMIKQRRIPTFKIGSDHRFHRDTIEKWMVEKAWC